MSYSLGEKRRVCPGCLFEKDAIDFPLARPKGDGTRIRFRLCAICVRQKSQAVMAEAMLRMLPASQPVAPIRPQPCGHPLSARQWDGSAVRCWVCSILGVSSGETDAQRGFTNLRG